MFEVELSRNALINISLGAEEEEVDEATVEEDKFNIDFTGVQFGSAAVQDLDPKDETNAKEDIFVADSSGVTTNSDAMREVVDEAKVEKDRIDVDVLGFGLNNEAGDIPEIFDVDVQQASFEMDILGTASDSASLGKVNVVDDAKVEKDTFQVDDLSSASYSATYMAVESSEEISEVDNDQWQYPVLQSASIEDKANNGTHESLEPEPRTVVKVKEQDKLDFGVDEGSAFDTHEEQQAVDYDWQEQNVTTFDEQEQDQYIIGSRRQVNSIIGLPMQIQSVVVYSKPNQSIVASHRKDESIAVVPKKIQSVVAYKKPDQSIVASHKEDQSIVSVPEQIKSIVGYSKAEQSIIGLHKQQQSIVHISQEKQSIVGFHKQDLSIFSTSKESQTKKLDIPESHDALSIEEIAAKEDFHSLQKHKEDFIEEAPEMITSKKINEEHLAMVEEQKSISMGEEQLIVTDESISVIEVEMETYEDKSLHLSEEEALWAEDEVGISEDEEHYEVEEMFVSPEQDMQESPHDKMDPQALQRMLRELAEKNYLLGNKFFVFPEVLKANSTIALYFNRDLSAIANEPDVLIKGAFNGWKWKFFTEKLHKSELGGDWWSCKLYIPKQAYRFDFVFFNGSTMYENNGKNDFVIQIESTMDEHSFADFLDEEKQRELERFAMEEAERKKQTEEEKRIKEERVAHEAAKAQAKAEIVTKKNKLHNVLDSAKGSIDNLWYIEPITTVQEATVRVYYNRHSRPLIHSAEIWMHGGYNNWIDGLSFAERLVHHDDKDGDWWYADVVLPQRAYALDWVFADGPPGNARIYDNNGRQDFHSILPNNMTEEEYWAEEEQRIYTRLLQERREREEAIRMKAERRAKLKAEMKEKTMRMFLVSQKHIVYTEPLEIRAGTTVDVLYNPSNTVLNGKPEVWFRCSFNRWMHPGGVLPPQKMVKAEHGSHLKATVNVPQDAYIMDFVFSESEEGGIFDNRNGLDYHIPVFGSTAKEPPMHIVHIAVEMAPIAKVGGLGDVVTSLSRAVQDLGHNVEVILPKHDCLNLSNVKNLHIHQSFSWGGSEIKVWRGHVEDLCVYFLEPQNGMFGVGCVYGRNDDRRFGFFCHSALDFLLQSGSSPNIIHCHDWSSAPTAWLYKENYAQSSLANARVIFTIHNLEFGAHHIGKAMKYCDKATTVSNTYSREVSGHGAIAPHLGKFYGILNGIDPDIWDPYSDSFIPVHYTTENVVEGKAAAKRALQQKLGLQQNDVPIVGIISRLTAQKGIHLIKHAMRRTLERNGQVVLLGSAPDPRIQGDFANLANTLQGENHGRVKMCLTYDEPLSHLIYAGSDFILVPSIFEPCGLTQLVAMRYGAIPIVRKTGGLYDTVFDVDNDKERARARGLEPNGFSFDGADNNGVDYALNRAISAWFDARDWFHSLCKRVMEQDWSWNRPALDYIELYRSASKL
ncbi:starch synthase 3, chloroplastic/amyloplastic-like isoform X3 [Panicum virgatum]|nr:starch synthase 3, chloroplastic/amyloplastic-like isoform X3 [Panicum virgatum]